MLRNLNAEMARESLKPGDLAKVIGKSDKAVREKIKGSYGFTIREALTIRAELFPELDLEYLFADD